MWGVGRRRGRGGGALVCAAALATLVLAAPGARAEGGSPREVAQSAYSRGEAAAKEMRFAEALAAYEEALRVDPSAPFASTARVRAADLRGHAEGDFEPLRKLESVRRDPAKNRDRATIEALERDAHAFPDGPVRAETLLVVSQAYEHAFSEPEKALSALEPILDDRFADRGTRAMALSEALPLYRAKGDLDGALAAVSRDPTLLPSATKEVRAEVRRGKIATLCLGVLGVIGVLGLWGAVVTARRMKDIRALPGLVFRPALVGLAFYLGAGGAVFVRLYGTGGDPLPFLLLGAGIAALAALVRVISMANPGSRRRAAVSATLGVIGVLAMAYLVLWRSNGAYLTPLGL